MKHLLLLLSCATLITVQAQAQDKLITTDNDTIHCQIQYVSQGVLAFIVKGGKEQSKVGLAMLREYIWNGESKKITPTTDGVGWMIAEEQDPAQLHLDKASNFLTQGEPAFLAGMALLAAGSFITLSAAIVAGETSELETAKYLSFIGPGVMGVGAIIGMSAFIPITKAGLELKKVKLGEP